MKNLLMNKMKALETQKERLGLHYLNILEIVEWLRRNHFVYVWGEYTIKGFVPVIQGNEMYMYFKSLTEALEWACAISLQHIGKE